MVVARAGPPVRGKKVLADILTSDFGRVLFDRIDVFEVHDLFFKVVIFNLSLNSDDLLVSSGR